jgi:hypothetical protein
VVRGGTRQGEACDRHAQDDERADDMPAAADDFARTSEKPNSAAKIFVIHGSSVKLSRCAAIA